MAAYKCCGGYDDHEPGCTVNAPSGGRGGGEMNPQEQAKQVARKMLDFLTTSYAVSRNPHGGVSYPASELKSVCQSYLALSTQLSELQSENARLREALTLCSAELRQNITANEPGGSMDKALRKALKKAEKALSHGAGEKCVHELEHYACLTDVCVKCGEFSYDRCEPSQGEKEGQ